MPEDWLPPLAEMLETAYEEWDRLTVCYAFFSFAAAVLFAFGAMVAFAVMVGR